MRSAFALDVASKFFRALRRGQTEKRERRSHRIAYAIEAIPSPHSFLRETYVCAPPRICSVRIVGWRGLGRGARRESFRGAWTSYDNAGVRRRAPRRGSHLLVKIA